MSIPRRENFVCFVLQIGCIPMMCKVSIHICTAEVVGSNPVGASEFLGFLCNCFSCFITARILSLLTT